MTLKPQKKTKSNPKPNFPMKMRDSASTSEALIAAAVKAFARMGYEGTTVKQIAQIAKVNVSLVSYHFGGKKKLYQACLEKFGFARLETVRKLLQPSSSFLELRLRLSIFANEFFESHLENLELVSIIHREVQSGIENAPETFRKTFLRVFETIVAFLHDAQQKKIIRSDANPLIVAGSFFGSMVHTLTNDHVAKKFFNATVSDSSHRQVICEQLMICFVDGLHPDSPQFRSDK